MFDLPKDVRDFLDAQDRKAADERYERERDEILRARAEREVREEAAARQGENPQKWVALSDNEFSRKFAKEFGVNL